MPPKLNRPPDPSDPEYQLLRDRINFAFHVALFLCANSGLLFFEQFFRADWPWRVWLTGVWFMLLLAHTFWLFRLVKYTPPPS